MDKQPNINTEEFILIKSDASGSKRYRNLPYPDNLISRILDKETKATEDQAMGLTYALSLLSADERDLILRHFSDNEILDFLATDRGVSRSRIIQIMNKIISKLRDFPFAGYIEQGYSVYNSHYQSIMAYFEELAALPDDAASDRRAELIDLVKDLEIEFLDLPHAALLKVKRYGNCSTIGDLVKLCSRTGSDYDKYGWNIDIRWLGEKNRDVINVVMRKYKLLQN